jgi:hypothetical protein
VNLRKEWGIVTRIVTNYERKIDLSIGNAIFNNKGLKGAIVDGS